ncbi:MAG: hypothetical protein IKW50_03530 [Oscillospiraceae bacterium]|nr:hypothetical protein [Oscillospiraceae bacterium]
MKTVFKLLTALAAIAGAVYVIATYGDKIVAWAKKVLASCPCCDNTCECVCEGEGECQCGGECKCEGEGECQCEAPAEEAAEEAPVEEIVIEENEPVAEETDFAE